MLLKEFLPAPAFREFVKWYRIVHFHFENLSDVPLKLYPPKPEVCLHFFICGGEEVEVKDRQEKYRSFPAILTGQQTSLIKRHVCPDFLDFQIVFQPTGVFRLTGVPAYELTNGYIDAELVFPKYILAIALDKLQSAKAYDDLLPTGDRFMTALVRHQKSAHPIDAAIKMMLLYKGKVSLDYLAKESCLCTRQFERVGTHPKIYLKIIRFNRAYNLKNAYPKMDWLETAMACGYYDYQHLARNYRELTGHTPPELHLQERTAPEGLLGLTAELYKERAK